MQILGISLVLVAALPVARGVSECGQDLTACLMKVEGQQQAALAIFDYSAVCRSLANGDLCYENMEQTAVCRNFTEDINDLLGAEEKHQRNWCRQEVPIACLQGLQLCYRGYKNATADISTADFCSAANETRTCMDNLPCAPDDDARNQLNALEQIISKNVTVAQCNKPAQSGACHTQATQCLTPIENQIKAFETKFDFDGLCSIMVEAQTCFSKLLNNPDCDSEQAALNQTWDTFSKRYSNYCAGDGLAVPCLKELSNCTVLFTTRETLSRFKADPLYQCRATADLVRCWEKLENLTSCPPGLMSLVGGVATQQKIEAELRHDCGNVLTPCTYEPASCVIRVDVAIHQAEEAVDYDKICKLLQEQEKCISPYLSKPNCTNNMHLIHEKELVDNTSTSLCQQSSLSAVPAAKPCLRTVAGCAMPYVQQQQINPDSVNCSADAAFLRCIGGVTCAEPALQQAVISVKQQLAKEECGTQGKASSVSVSALLLLMMLGLKPVLLPG